MPPPRDPLSVRYDRAVRRILIQAIAAQRERRAVSTWVASSSGRDFRNLDNGGLTASERAFMRSVYYHTWREPINAGRPPDWSPDLQWGAIERRGSRYGRQVRIRMYLARSGSRHAGTLARRQQWRLDEGTWRSGGRRSVPGDRIDNNRQAGSG